MVLPTVLTAGCKSWGGGFNVCCRAQTSPRLLWEKHWPPFQLWEKLNCDCWQGNRHICTIPRDICTRMTMWWPSLGAHMNKKNVGSFFVMCINSINSSYGWTPKKAPVAVRVTSHLTEILWRVCRKSLLMLVKHPLKTMGVANCL